MTSHAIAPRTEGAHPFALFLRRMWGLILRQVYLLTGSWPRLVEILYWPMFNMMIWGFTSLFIVREVSNTTIVGTIFLAGVLLTEIFLRVSNGMMMFFLEEIWSRNFGHLFATPLKFSEYVISLLGLSIIRMAMGVIPAVIVAKLLFNFSLPSFGWPLLLLIPLLIFTGWWYGMLLIALLLRFGLAAEWVAWMSTMLIIPFIAPYYPVTILPGWMQVISFSLPPTYVFQSMKALIAGQPVAGIDLLKALALNILYFIGASAVFYHAYQGARRRGGLLQVGE